MNYFRHHAVSLLLAGSLLLCDQVSALPTIELVGDPLMIICQMKTAQTFGYNSFDISNFNPNAYDKLRAVNTTHLNITGRPHDQLASRIGSSLKNFYVNADDADSLTPQSLDLIARLSTEPTLVAGFLGMSLHDIFYLSSMWEICYKNYKLPLPKTHLVKNKIPCTALLRLLGRPSHKKTAGLVDGAIYTFHNMMKFCQKNDKNFIIALPTGKAHYSNKSNAIKKIAQKYQCLEYHVLIKYLESKKIDITLIALDSMNLVHEQITQLESVKLTDEDIALLEKETTETISSKSLSNKDLFFLQNFLMPLVTDIPHLTHMPISRL